MQTILVNLGQNNSQAMREFHVISGINERGQKENCLRVTTGERGIKTLTDNNASVKLEYIVLVSGITEYANYRDYAFVNIQKVENALIDAGYLKYSDKNDASYL